LLLLLVLILRLSGDAVKKKLLSQSIGMTTAFTFSQSSSEWKGRQQPMRNGYQQSLRGASTAAS
jgi:hypothetical protein